MISFALLRRAMFWKPTLLVFGAIALIQPSLATVTPSQPVREPAFRLSQGNADWDVAVQVLRLLNDRQEVSDLVVHLNILEKPETSYANAVYQVFARSEGRWQEIYTNTGARLIEGQAGALMIAPEVISLADLQGDLETHGIDLATAELRVVVQVRYDVRGGRRDQWLELEQVQSYGAIAQISTLDLLEISNGVTADGSASVEPSTATPPGDRPRRPRPTTGSSGGNSTSGSSSRETEVITLSNGYRITFLGVSYSGNTSTWRYYMEELPSAQDLSNWVLELPRCATLLEASPQGELVNPDPNAQLSGIKWQPGGGFVEGEFSVTLSGNLQLGRTRVAAKGPDVERGELAGPACEGSTTAPGGAATR